MFVIMENKRISHLKTFSHDIIIGRTRKKHTLQETNKFDHVRRTAACFSVTDSDTGRQKKAREIAEN